MIDKYLSIIGYYLSIFNKYEEFNFLPDLFPLSQLPHGITALLNQFLKMCQQLADI